MSFASLGLSENFLETLKKLNFINPYPIQKEAIPVILQHRDMLGVAKTGSGKTAAYVLPILMKRMEKQSAHNRQIDVLVVIPTRELAIQIAEVFTQFSQSLPHKIKVKAVYGGVSINPQMKGMMGVNILIATPGRLLELLEVNAVDLSKIDTFVLDEADKLLHIGFADELNRIIEKLPANRQNLLFSATLSEEILKIEKLLLKNPQLIKIDEDTESIDHIIQVAYYISDEKKGPLLRHIIRSKEMKQVLIFTSSIQRADIIASKLSKNGIEAHAIHSKKSQGARTDLLTKFKHGRIRVLVTTDLLSRGIDIEYLPYVINYELPRSPKDYLHRIGRTGRAESSGEAISLISPSEEAHFRVIQKKMGKWATRIDGNDLF